MPGTELVQVFFRFYSEIMEEETTETLWAEVVHLEHGYYKLNSIPFYAAKIAPGDVIWAEYNNNEGMLTYRKTVKHSGNSIIHAIIMDDAHKVDDISEIFEAMGCEPAVINHKYFALKVPAAMDYIPVKRKLDELEKNEIIGYAESCLSEKHQYKSVSFPGSLNER